MILALVNLSKLDCISIVKSMGYGEVYSLMTPTYFGKYFYEACTAKIGET